MYRFAVALVTAVALALAPALAPAPVQAKELGASQVQIPVSGTIDLSTSAPGVFEGTFTLLKFVNDNGSVVAVGTIAGTARDDAGHILKTGLQTVALPVSTGRGASAASAIAAASCPILNLVLGPLDLNLLGLTVHLNQVVLNITAVPGAGNLLGILLCAVAGLLD